MKKRITAVLTGMLMLSTLIGCSSDGSSEDNSTIKSAQFVLKDASLTAQVQEIDGNSLTVSIGGGGMNMPGGMGGGPDLAGEVPDDFDGEMPDDMDGDVPEMPDGDAPDMDGGFSGSSQSEATLYISDEAVVEIESEGGETTSGSISDITSGDSLSIIFGSDGEITGVTVLSNSGFAIPEDNGEAA